MSKETNLRTDDWIPAIMRMGRNHGVPKPLLFDYANAVAKEIDGDWTLIDFAVFCRGAAAVWAGRETASPTYEAGPYYKICQKCASRFSGSIASNHCAPCYDYIRSTTAK